MYDSSVNNGANRPPIERHSAVRSVSAFREKFLWPHNPLRLRIENRHVSNRSLRESSTGKSKKPCRSARHFLYQRGKVNMSGSYEIRHGYGECSLESDDSVRSIGKLSLLLVVIMRGVISRNHVYRSVLHGVAQCCHVLRCPERRVHLCVGVIAGDAFFCER